ncbi:hypothetical protein BDZ94DRAFT_1262446 [Collybia nuda]|uniref:Uncharacterized protein n=1 Tax=Collybia nuda TaxID=64659 RepID=A0A9P6CH42_9AGAR|nr:hypothetical protein BDZ94DRAFT_1262446 [Collybia nuda]
MGTRKRKNKAEMCPVRKKCILGLMLGIASSRVLFLISIFFPLPSSTSLASHSYASYVPNIAPPAFIPIPIPLQFTHSSAGSHHRRDCLPHPAPSRHQSITSTRNSRHFVSSTSRRSEGGANDGLGNFVLIIDVIL